MKKMLIVFLTILSFSQLMSSTINWSTPPVALSSLSASDPQVAMDGSGNLVAAWVENGFVIANTKPVSGNWGTAVTLSGSGASFPRIVSDSSGNATAVWLEGGIVKASSKPVNMSWTAAVSLSLTGAASPSIGVDSAGDVVAAWTRNGGIEVSTKLFNANWQSRVAITSSNASSPQVAIGGTGASTRAFVVWFGISGGTNIVYYSSKLISFGSWTSQVAISDTTHNAAYPAIAVDSNGNALAVWYAFDITNSIYSNVNVQSATRLSTSTTWGAPVSISDPGIRNPASLGARVGFDSTGNALAIWLTSFDDEVYTLQSATKLLRQNWSAPTTITQNLYAQAADLSVMSLGDALSLYMFYDGTNLRIQSSESDSSGFMENTWSLPMVVSLGTDNAFPKVAATPIGNTINAATLWVQYNGSVNTILASTGTRSIVLPPSNLTVTQDVNNFNVFSEYYNTVSWTASSDPNVAGYLIYRNGTLIDKVDKTVTQITDDNRVQNGSVVYSVASFDNQNSQSQIMSVSFP